MCFLRGPLRWVNKQKNPKYAKRTAWYNEFRYKFWNSCDVFAPWVPEGFFSLFKFAAKIERRNRDREERERAVFFPLITIAASPLNFLRKQQEKNPLAPRGMHLRHSLRKLEFALHDFGVFEVCLRVLCHRFPKQHYTSRNAGESRLCR